MELVAGVTRDMLVWVVAVIDTSSEAPGATDLIGDGQIAFGLCGQLQMQKL